VAGAEAAYRAAAAGDEVTLFERSGAIGGRARVAGSRRGRERWGLYLDWLVEQLTTTGVDVRLGSDPGVDEVLDLEPDAVVLATGSVLRRPVWADGQPYVDADAVAEHAPPPPHPGATAVVVDDEGGFIAPTAAEALVAAGWTVRVTTPLPAVAIRVDPTQVWFVRRRLKLAGVQLLSQVQLVHRADEGWVLVDVESDEVTPAGPVDLVVVAGTRRARDELGAGLASRRPELLVTRIGDALAPRSLLDAVAEGARAGLTLRERPLDLVPATASSNSGG
jgi:pyruvate/2-oxoglutarate dehydrogenase complex dihydrolipoamide dehydrogenase (E3) component